VTRAALVVPVAVIGFIVVCGVADVIGRGETADAWVAAVRTGVLWGVLMGLLVAGIIYADRHHRRRVRALDAEQHDGDDRL